MADFTTQELSKVMENLRAIRATADLLCMAADTAREDRQEFLENTLADIGEHLEELATEGLVILRYEGSMKRAAQAAPEGGAV